RLQHPVELFVGQKPVAEREYEGAHLRELESGEARPGSERAAAHAARPATTAQRPIQREAEDLQRIHHRRPEPRLEAERMHAARDLVGDDQRSQRDGEQDTYEWAGAAKRRYL